MKRDRAMDPKPALRTHMGLGRVGPKLADAAVMEISKMKRCDYD